MLILKSATKITLLALVIVLCISTLVSVTFGTIRGVLDPTKVLEMFGSVVLFVMGYYFSKRPDTSIVKNPNEDN